MSSQPVTASQYTGRGAPRLHLVGQGVDGGPGRRMAGDFPPELVRAARDGQVEAWVLLVEWWGPRLLGFCRAQVGRDAEDVVQDVLLTVWRKLPDLDDPTRFRGWLYAIARNRCREIARTGARRATDPMAPEDFATRPGHQPGPEVDHLAAETLTALSAVLAGLPPHLARPWRLAEVEHMSYAEIAEVEAVPISTVRGRLARARTAVTAAMEEWR